MLFRGKTVIMLANLRIAAAASPASGILHQQLFPPRLLFAECFSSKNCATITNDSSFTVSYLISSCGLSPEAALSASRSIQIRSTAQPDSVIALFKSHGFTDTHISKLTKTCPRLLFSNPSNTIFPKLEFFTSLGVPTDVLAKSLSSTPLLFLTSLENRIRPAYNFLRDVLLLDDEKVKRVFATTPWMFGEDPEKCMAPKIAILRAKGVPLSKLSYLFTYHSCRRSSLLQSHTQFEKAVKKVVELGVNPSKFVFVTALHAVSGLSDSTWNDKIKAFKKYGWSEDNIRVAFTRQPQIISMSEQKIISMMDFFVSGLGLKPSALAKTPWILLYSLENRIIPRCSVISLLKSNGLLLIDKVNISTLLCTSNNNFLESYVSKYADLIPQLIDIFEGRSAAAAEFSFAFASSANISHTGP